MERRRAVALTVLTIIAIVLRSLIVLGGLQQIFGLVFQEQLGRLGQAGFGQPGADPQMVEAQRAMQDALLERQREWNPFNWIVAPLAILFGLGLVVSGATSLKLNPGGRKMLAILCAVGVLFDLVRESAAMIMSLGMSEVMQEHMRGMVPGHNAQAEALTSGIMSASMAASVAFVGAWMLLKVGFYVWGLVYLTRERTRQVFEGAAG